MKLQKMAGVYTVNAHGYSRYISKSMKRGENDLRQLMVIIRTNEISKKQI